MYLSDHAELIRLYASFYHTIGLNVTCISNEKNAHNSTDKNLLKSPNHEWEYLIKKRQAIEELMSYNWQKAIGVGFVAGSYSNENIAAIDIDGNSNDELLEIALIDILNILRLPLDYEWIIKSGSGKGYHIIFRWSEEGSYDGYLTRFKIPYSVICFLPNLKYYNYFKQVELKFQGHMVLPPSLHSSYNYYSFRNGKLPEKGLDFTSQTFFQELSEKIFAKSFYTFAQDSQGYYGELLHEETILNSLDNGRALGDFKPTSPYFLFLDVETNGLPLDYNSPIDDTNNWPRIIEIAWAVFDKYNHIILIKNFFIEPEGFIINKECEELTRRNKRVEDHKKVNIIDAIRDINRWIEKIDYIVGHNIEYDINCLLSENYRNKVVNSILEKKVICTMKESTDYCQIKNAHGYKFPKLEELYFKLFNANFNEAHGADKDVMTTARCFWRLKEKGIIKIDDLI